MEESIDDVVNELVELFSSKSPFPRIPKNASEKEKENIIMSNIKSNLDYVKMCVKYSLFDLDATKNEKKYLAEENEQLIRILDQEDDYDYDYY